MKNINNDNMKNIFKNIKKFLFNLSNAKIIFIVYFILIFSSSLILLSPDAYNEGKSVSYIDALFTAASAFSDTGLVIVPTWETWSMLGQAIIAVLILFGGIGIFAIKVYIFNFILGRKLKLSTNNILGSERSSKDHSLSKKTIVVSVTLIFSLIVIASVILSFIFYYQNPDSLENMQSPKGDISLSIRYAVFHSISAINNAGFDIIGSSSLAPYYSAYSIQIIFIILFIVGGIGYPVIFDTYSWISHKIKRKPGKYSFSLFSKISCISYLSISIIGLILAFSFELSSVEALDGDMIPLWLTDKSTGSKVMAIFFNTFSTRNAGFSTINLKELSQPTIILYAIMMFIGSAPSSTAGGIRTTTIALIVLSIWSKIRGVPNVRIFNRKIPRETTYTAGIVLSISLFIVFFVSFITMSSIHGNFEGYGYIDVIFEVSSAFGTTGLSTGLTPSLNTISKIFLILTMFIGQLGVSSTILVWRSNRNKQYKIDYIQEDIAIG